MKIGYARVSTVDQKLDLQTDALYKAGCKRVYADKVSGSKTNRPQLNKLKEVLREGDTLIVWRLDRLGRSLKDLIEWMAFFNKEGVAFKSLHENIDTNTPTGKLTYNIFASIAEFESDLIRERTKAGLAAARARGKLGGRKPKIGVQKQKLAVKLYHEKEHTVKEICAMMSISKPTLYAYIQKHQA